jgi:alpha-mannosidase
MAEVLNQPLFTMFGTSHPDGDLPMVGSFIKVAPENIMATVLKQAEDNDDLILRAVEVNKSQTHARIELPFINRTIDAEFKPGEIKTFRLPKDSTKSIQEVNLLEDPIE